MKEVRIYFYRPDIDGHLLDNGISLIEQLWALPLEVSTFDFKRAGIILKLRTSHAEIEDHEGRMMYTSTMRMNDTKVNGVVKRMSPPVLENRHRWYYYKIEVHEDVHKLTFDMLDEDVANNQGYDKRYITKFVTGKHSRKLIEWITKNPLNNPNRYICSGLTYKGAYAAVKEEFEKYKRYFRLLFELEKLARKFNNDEPDPLNLSLAFHDAGLTPYSAVDDKPLIEVSK